jgi:VanZ family protein
MTSAATRWGSALVNAAYAVVLVFATHYPRPDELVPQIALVSDKLLHFAAYGVLGSLTMATFLAWRGAPRPAAIAGLFAGLALFAVGDEVTQPLFSRAAEPLDWVADCLGLAVGMLVTGMAVAAAVRLAASRRRFPTSR